MINRIERAWQGNQAEISDTRGASIEPLILEPRDAQISLLRLQGEEVEDHQMIEIVNHLA